MSYHYIPIVLSFDIQFWWISIIILVLTTMIWIYEALYIILYFVFGVYFNNTVMKSGLSHLLRIYWQHLSWHFFISDCRFMMVKYSVITNIQWNIFPKNCYPFLYKLSNILHGIPISDHYVRNFFLQDC